MADAGRGALRASSRVVVGLWTLATVLVGLSFSLWFRHSAEGILPEYRSNPWIWIAIPSVVAAGFATLRWARGTGPVEETAQASPPPNATRRLVLGGLAGSAATVVGASAISVARNLAWFRTTMPALAPKTPTSTPMRDEWKGSTVREYRRLGRTNVRVSDISLGSGQIRPGKGERVAKLAIDRGVNYFDTAPDYSEAGSELALGRAIKDRRGQIFLATKFCTPNGHLAPGASVADYMRVVEDSLGRLQTDYVDLIHIHGCETLERLMDENAHEAFDRLKEQGKARFLGVSTHTPNLEAIADRAIESGRFDVMMLAYHHGAWPRLGELIDRAAAADIGIVAMKTLKGAKHKGLDEFIAERDSYPQAAFRWVLSNPSVSALVISFSELAHVDEYLYASGQRPRADDSAILSKYDRLIAGKHCFQHCGRCLDACPENLAIHDVLRHRMYFEDYGDEKEAMRLYSQLEKKADVCLGCVAPCAGSCPFGIAIQQRTLEAHAMLTWNARS